jgi:hypothetical protein
MRLGSASSSANGGGLAARGPSCPPLTPLRLLRLPSSSSAVGPGSYDSSAEEDPLTSDAACAAAAAAAVEAAASPGGMRPPRGNGEAAAEGEGGAPSRSASAIVLSRVPLLRIVVSSGASPLPLSFGFRLCLRSAAPAAAGRDQRSDGRRRTMGRNGGEPTRKGHGREGKGRGGGRNSSAGRRTTLRTMMCACFACVCPPSAFAFAC